MKRPMKNLGVVALGVAILSLLVFQLPALAGFHGHGRAGGTMQKMIAALDLSEEQKLQIKDLITAKQPEIQPFRKQLILERRALRDLIQSDPLDESAIRSQAERVATFQTDMAVQRARVYNEVGQILTLEQKQKFLELQKARDLKIDGFLSRVSPRAQ